MKAKTIEINNNRLKYLLSLVLAKQELLNLKQNLKSIIKGHKK